MCFSKHLTQAGTIHHLTIHDSPEQNGVAKYLNQTLLEWTHAMLHSSSLLKYLWGQCIKHTVWLKNRTFTCALNGKTPCKAILNSKPNLNGLPEWGSQVWVHNASNSKLDARAMTGHWMGYDTEIKDSCVYWPERRKVSVEHNICFDPEFIVIRSEAEFEKKSHHEPLPTSDHPTDTSSPFTLGTPSHEETINIPFLRFQSKQTWKPSTYIQ